MADVPRIVVGVVPPEGDGRGVPHVEKGPQAQVEAEEGARTDQQDNQGHAPGVPDDDLQEVV